MKSAEIACNGTPGGGNESYCHTQNLRKGNDMAGSEWDLIACTWSGTDSDGRASENFSYNKAPNKYDRTRWEIDENNHSGEIEFDVYKDVENASDERIHNHMHHGSEVNMRGGGHKRLYISHTRNAHNKRFRVFVYGKES